MAHGTPTGFVFAPPTGAVEPSALDPLETSHATLYSPGDDENTRESLRLWDDRRQDSCPFEHRGWSKDRRRVYAAMCRTDQTAARKHDFATCRDHMHVCQNTATGELKILPQTCKDRFCIPCGHARSWRVARALEDLMKQAETKLMFITLTLRGRPGDSLRQMIDELRDGWTRLRKLDGWRHTVVGGGVMLEVKWSSLSGGHWHPHYHIIAEGKWLDEDWLKRAWSVLTRGSDQVKVLPIKDPGAALSYVAKYASKPTDPSFIRRPWLLDEAMKTLKGERLCACFGTWHGTPLQPKGGDDEEHIPGSPWMYVGTLGDLECKAERGDVEARSIVDACRRLLALKHALSERCRGPTQDHSTAGTAPDPAAAAAARDTRARSLDVAGKLFGETDVHRLG